MNNLKPIEELTTKRKALTLTPKEAHEQETKELELTILTKILIQLQRIIK